MSEFQPQRSVSRSGKGARKRVTVFLLLAGWVGLVSCETLVNTIPDSKLPKTESQLTLFSFISPQDSVIKVKVGQTTPVFSTVPIMPEPPFVLVDGDTVFTNSDTFSGATVTITNGESKVTLPYRPKDEVYAIPISQFPIRAGQTYTLTVTDGRRTAKATCKVPSEQVAIKNYALDTLYTSIFGRRDTTLRLSYTWDDLPGKADFYRVRAFELYEYSVLTFNEAELYLIEKRKQNRFYFSWNATGNRSVFQNDVNIDGTTFSSPQGQKKPEKEEVFRQLSGNTSKPDRSPELLGVYLQLLHTDENYYLYHRSLQQTRRDNPFSEPALVYTNVDGGLGIFAGYSLTNKIIKP